MKLPITDLQFCPSSCYLCCVRLRNSPQHTVLKYFQSMYFP